MILPTDKIIQLDSSELTMRLKFFFLMQSFLETEGKDIYFIPQAELARRFHIHEKTIEAALRDLRGYDQN